MIELRDYQTASIGAIMSYWGEGGGNPLVDMATGLGKSVVIAKLIQDLIDGYPDMRVLCLVHVRELVRQNVQAILRLWPSAPIGVYSAGLNKRQVGRKITYASIQSVWRQDSYSLGPMDLVIIDEAHLTPKDGEGMYRTLLQKLRDRRPDMRVAGFTATPFRLDSGRLDDGSDRLFDRIVHSYGIREGIEAGWLAPLKSKNALASYDVRNVAKRGGEFIPGALEAAVDLDHLTRAAVGETIALAKDRRSWLIFCSGVNHAHHVADALRLAGVSVGTVTAKTPTHERDWIVREFKAGRIRALTGANIFTTGFDAPNVDLISILRPTLSTGLHVQMIGRGTRKAEGKDDGCLILDFAGNIRRHGPVDMVVLDTDRRKPSEKLGAATVDSIRAKSCPNCNELVSLGVMECPDCGYEWPRPVKPKHDATADADTPVISTGPKLSRAQLVMQPKELEVRSWEARRHVKEGSPYASLRVIYYAGLLQISEWVLLEHGGWGHERAKRWWADHGGGQLPLDVTDALAKFHTLRAPVSILVRREGKFDRVVGRRFSARAA